MAACIDTQTNFLGIPTGPVPMKTDEARPDIDDEPILSNYYHSSIREVEKRSNMEFGLKGEHIENNDVVENFAEWDSALVYDHYEGDEDVIEEFHGQLYNGVQALIIRIFNFVSNHETKGEAAHDALMEKQVQQVEVKENEGILKGL
ncbi:hypothetical protein ACFX1R_042006 [Malus domestica]